MTHREWHWTAFAIPSNIYFGRHPMVGGHWNCWQSNFETAAERALKRSSGVQFSVLKTTMEGDRKYFPQTPLFHSMKDWKYSPPTEIKLFVRPLSYIVFCLPLKPVFGLNKLNFRRKVTFGVLNIQKGWGSPNKDLVFYCFLKRDDPPWNRIFTYGHQLSLLPSLSIAKTQTKSSHNSATKHWAVLLCLPRSEDLSSRMCKCPVVNNFCCCCPLYVCIIVLAFLDIKLSQLCIFSLETSKPM